MLLIFLFFHKALSNVKKDRTVINATDKYSRNLSSPMEQTFQIKLKANLKYKFRAISWKTLQNNNDVA